MTPNESVELVYVRKLEKGNRIIFEWRKVVCIKS